MASNAAGTGPAGGFLVRCAQHRARRNAAEYQCAINDFRVRGPRFVLLDQQITM